jgi:hypothetical protein
MYDFLKIGAEVTFQCLHDIKLIVEEFNEFKGNVRCKYYDENLKRFIKLTLPAELLTPLGKPRGPVAPRPKAHL